MGIRKHVGISDAGNTEEESSVKILVFCNKGFETMEFAPFIDVFGWAKFDCGV